MAELARVVLGIVMVNVLVGGALGIGWLFARLLVRLGADSTDSTFGDAVAGLIALMLIVLVAVSVWEFGGWAYDVLVLVRPLR